MDRAHNGGQMVHIILESGNLTKLQERELCIMLMGTFMRDNGKMTNPMDLESTVILMGLFMKVNGKTINSMEKESYDLRRGKCWLKESGRMDSKFIEH